MQKIILLSLILGLSACTKNRTETPPVKEVPTSLAQTWNSGTGEFNGSIDFGVLTSNQSKVNTVTIKNVGAETLMGPVVLTGADFDLVYQNCTTLLVGKTCTVKVVFSATGKPNGIYTGVLKIGESEADLSAGINIPEVTENLSALVNSIPASSVNFGVVKYNKSVLKTILIKNHNSVGAPLGPISLSGNNFIVNYDTCSNKTLKAKQTCQIKLSLSGAGKSGTIQEDLTIGSLSLPVSAEVKNLETLSASGSDVKVMLNNQVVTNLVMDMGTWNQNKVQIINLFLKNLGSEASILGPITVGNKLQLISTTCAELLSPKASCLVKISSNPSTTGTFSEVVNVKGNAYSVQAVVRVPGEKISCPIDNADAAYITWDGTSYSQCQIESCEATHHLSGNVCEDNIAACSIENGTGTQTWANGTWGSCVVSGCDGAFHPVGNSCISNTQSCSIENALVATETWLGSTWGNCTVQTCANDYHKVNNACVFNTQSCPIDNGQGKQQWAGNDWGACTVDTCNPNFHPDNNACVPDTRTIAITQPPVSQGSINGPTTVTYNTGATFTYTPAPGYGLTAWGGDCLGQTGNTCILNNIITNKSVSVSAACKSGYALSGSSCVPTLALTAGNCTANPLFAYAPCTLSVSGGAGEVTLSTTYGTVNSATKQYIPNCVNNSGSATVTAKDADNNTSSINLSVTCVYSGCSEIKAKSYGLTGGNFWVDMDGYATSNPLNVYCDMSNNSYTEIFDLIRQPSLTSADVLSKLNIFTTTALASGQVVKDGNGVYWKNTSGIEGLTYSLNKYPVGSVKVRINRVTETNSWQGGLSIHTINKTNCASNWSAGNSCLNNILKGTHQPSLSVFNYNDSGFGGPQWYFEGLSGSTTYTAGLNSEHILNDVPSNGVHFTTFGRTESGTTTPQSLFHITQFKFKDIYHHHPVSCADAFTKGALNSLNNTSSGIYTLDEDGFELENPPALVYCDMSTTGVATLTSSCLDAKRFGQLNSASSTASGYFTLDLDGVGSGASTTQSIYCDQSSLGGGWALISNSSISSTSYPANTSLATSTNFNLQSFFPAGISANNKMVKIKGGVLTEYVYDTTNTWKSVKDNATKLRSNGSTGGANYLWYTEDTYANAYPLLGPANHGSWCNSSNSFVFFMTTAANPANGIFAGSNAYQGACNSGAYYSDNFNWQVFSR
jgi:hypothetical protein